MEWIKRPGNEGAGPFKLVLSYVARHGWCLVIWTFHPFYSRGFHKGGEERRTTYLETRLLRVMFSAPLNRSLNAWGEMFVHTCVEDGTQNYKLEALVSKIFVTMASQSSSSDTTNPPGSNGGAKSQKKKGGKGGGSGKAFFLPPFPQHLRLLKNITWYRFIPPSRPSS